MTQIASGSLTSGDALNLTSISGSYEDLRLVLRGVSVSLDSALDMVVNSLRGTNYSFLSNANNGGSLGDSTSVAQSKMPISSGDLKGGTTNFSMVCDFYDYANTTGHKQARYSVTYLNNSSVVVQIFSNAVLRNTGAVDNLRLELTSGSFSAGTYELFGVK